MITELPWLILFLPLFAAAGITLFTLPHARISAALSIGAVLGAFVLSAVVFFALPEARYGAPVQVGWISVGDFQADMGLQLDQLSLLMLLVVTGVGGLIHIYSYGYMKDDPGMGRYFACMSLFTFSMLGIVLSDNLIQLFVFWELVGVSSYLLIGFWHERPSAADACKKAFLTNRLGDFGFILGILIVWAALGTLNFRELQQIMETNPAALGGMATLAGLLLFCGALGKSAQFPLHVWLPDAMEGPTPVSALIHAATMVAAGVYMLCRILFLLDGPSLFVIAWIGGVTSLLAALMAVQQDDIKRILAYSTLSQLGYMVMAVGLNAPSPAMYHLTTHAFFKALLFLGAGSVICALHHQQNIWKMGGLKTRMPVTYWTFLIGTLALCGVPPFSGFYSKESILTAAWETQPPLFGVAVIVAALTTFYMTRLVLIAFHGDERDDAVSHAKESPAVMARPLMVLAIPSFVAGFWSIEYFLSAQFHDLHEPAETASSLSHLYSAFVHSPGPALFGLFAVMVGFSMAYGLYRNAKSDPLPASLGVFARAMKERFYLDELYLAIIRKTHDSVARAVDGFDRWIIAGLCVRGTHGSAELLGRILRMLQTGGLAAYTFLFGLGAALLLYLVLL